MLPVNRYGIMAGITANDPLFECDFEGNSAVGFTNGSEWHNIDSVPDNSNSDEDGVAADVPGRIYGNSSSHGMFFGDTTTAEPTSQAGYPNSDKGITDLITPFIDLTNSVSPRMYFEHWYQGIIYDADELFDAGFVFVKPSGESEVKVVPVGGYPASGQFNSTTTWGYSHLYDEEEGLVPALSDWETAEFDLSAFNGKSIQIIFRFVANADDIHSGGWYLDDIAVVETADLTDPEIDGPEDFSIFVGTNGNNITWNVTEDNPNWFNITQNGQLINNSAWDGSNLTIFIDGLNPGVYVFNCTVYDQTNNTNWDMVILTVIDPDNPLIIGPPDSNYTESKTGNFITWNCSDDYPSWFNITRNGQLINNSAWDGSNLTINIDGLSTGSYNFTCTLIDMSNNTASDSVIIDVTSSIPVLAGPGTSSYDEGSSGNYITWLASEPDPDYYNITREGILLDSGPWNGSNLQTNVDGLAAGMYSYSCYVNDTYGYENIDTVILTVRDPIIPVISGINDISFVQGTNGHWVNFTCSDNHPFWYNVTLDGTIYLDGSWDGSDININVDDLSIGIHVFICTVVDISGNNAVDTVIVSVTDGTNPVISNVPDLTLDEDETGIITWITSDLNPLEYKIWRNGVLISHAEWTGPIINISLNGLIAGTYNYTCQIMDIDGNTASDTLFVTVKTTDSSPPVVYAEENYIFQERSQNYAVVIADDEHPYWITVMMNSTLYLNNSWDGSYLYIDASQLAVGSYIYNATFIDINGNTANIVFSVTITPLQSVTLSTETTTGTTTTGSSNTETTRDTPSFTLFSLVLIIIPVIILRIKQKNSKE